MTQMGLEYQKFKETSRHNIEDEGIRKQSNVISQQDIDTKKYDADTRRYVSSFEPQKADASTLQAKASKSQADTAAGKLALDSEYREREVLAKEATAAAQSSQATTAHQKARAEHISRLMDDLAVQEAAKMAYKQLTGDSRLLTMESQGFLKFLEQYANTLVNAAAKSK